MPPIWVHWKVSRVFTTHPATFSEICNMLLFRSILRMCVQNLKFVALPVPEIIGGTQKIGQSLRPRSIFSQIFNRLLCLWATNSEGVGLSVRAISFQDFRPMWSWSTNVKDGQTDRQTDGQTDGRHAISIPRYALVHRALKTIAYIGKHAVKYQHNFDPSVCFSLGMLSC